MKVVVVGGGIYGQVVAWRLALRGVEVVVVEPHGPGHAGSGSGDRSRIVRALYGERSFSLAGHASLALFRAWGDELGEELVDFSGVLYLERDGSGEGDVAFRSYVDRGLGHLASLGAAVETWSPDEVARRHPAIDPRGLSRAVFEPGAGIGKAARTTRAIARASLRTGRVTHIADRALRVETHAARVTGVRLERGELLRVDHVVVAAGLGGVALVESLLPARLPIRAIPHFTSYWDVAWPEGRMLQRDLLPAWAELGASLYGFPDDGESGFKVAWHEPLRAASAGERESSHVDGFPALGPPGVDEVEAVRAAVSVRFPAMKRARLRATYQCAYDATPDENFLVGPIPGVDGVTFVGGMSGHGYKHAPAIGEAVAGSLLGERPSLDLAPYSLESRLR